MYHFLIVDDEAEAAASLRRLVERYTRSHQLEVDIQWMKSAFEFMDCKKRFDLVFMDIELPGINGMEASGMLRTYDDETLIIFVTNLAQYAVKGYEVGALDFVVKPVSYSNLRMRLDRAMRILRRNTGKSLYVPTKYGMHAFPLSSLLYVEIRGHNLSYHLEEGDPVEVRGTLAKIEGDLDQAQFVRISNSCIINAGHIRSVDGSDVRMSNGEVLAMSRTRRKAALEALANYFGGN
ncbi:two component transcriptional regulator, LytTR family [Olsenella uli DSM 7084]|uniref:Two component transcriptional regulator, LytTR family n=1 Tax=Olsenella uli (strain ATCC 49627 / DSM 7084 / CCUG 31166 / CIP 109912 / JCM 12494 / LMG 11480 / NCIMB 702895 / VPI D76D-27C) TaxID=633147 RepID=E1QXG2_OLSUV|nr:LytTR family DNA-binding domain-containing protein [Olsenella uli]ADK68815.1 two component transcriptional regulator, LytTR family [Olsenella uli DSM 7084]KRO12298.1 LytTR family two component transcriptional regulator [Olsenella uli DSM 7084]